MYREYSLVGFFHWTGLVLNVATKAGAYVISVTNGEQHGMFFEN